MTHLRTGLALLLGLGFFWGGLPAQEEKAELIVDTARRFLDFTARGEYRQAVQNFDAVMQEKMTADQLQKVWASVLKQAGDFQKLRDTRIEESGGYSIVFLICQFAKAVLDVKVVFNTEKQITGLWFAPHSPPQIYTPPQYADPSLFSEEEVTVGQAPWALPATLTLPKNGSKPLPAVVLVHGSGPNDRDETLGPNKPFKDLAWGLATRGIAVLRYEKRTRVYRKEFLNPEKAFTVREESVDDALAAAALLRRIPRIDAERVFVLGHSLGGMLIPRIGARAPEAAGFIILAGATRSAEDAILDQIEYIASLDGKWTEEEKKQYADYQNAAAKIKKLKPSDRTSREAYMGAYAAYWIDLQDYDPPREARRLQRPLLILQGERDYQVTTEDFQNWRSALQGSAGVTFKLYPSLNHLFISGSGKSSPSEYQRKGNVDEQVIEDIASWIRNQET
jgi:dienelactone hydrolase